MAIRQLHDLNASSGTLLVQGLSGANPCIFVEILQRPQCLVVFPSVSSEKACLAAPCFMHFLPFHEFSISV